MVFSPRNRWCSRLDPRNSSIAAKNCAWDFSRSRRLPFLKQTLLQQTFFFGVAGRCFCDCDLQVWVFFSKKLGKVCWIIIHMSVAQILCTKNELKNNVVSCLSIYHEYVYYINMYFKRFLHFHPQSINPPYSSHQITQPCLNTTSRNVTSKAKIKAKIPSPIRKICCQMAQVSTFQLFNGEVRGSNKIAGIVVVVVVVVVLVVLVVVVVVVVVVDLSGLQKWSWKPGTPKFKYEWHHYHCKLGLEGISVVHVGGGLISYLISQWLCLRKCMKEKPTALSFVRFIKKTTVWLFPTLEVCCVFFLQAILGRGLSYPIGSLFSTKNAKALQNDFVQRLMVNSSQKDLCVFQSRHRDSWKFMAWLKLSQIQNGPTTKTLCGIPFFKLASTNRDTLPETNIFAPENGWLEDYFPFGMAYFQRRTVSFREGTHNVSW